MPECFTARVFSQVKSIYFATHRVNTKNINIIVIVLRQRSPNETKRLMSFGLPYYNPIKPGSGSIKYEFIYNNMVFTLTYRKDKLLIFS